MESCKHHKGQEQQLQTSRTRCFQLKHYLRKYGFILFSVQNVFLHELLMAHLVCGLVLSRCSAVCASNSGK